MPSQFETQFATASADLFTTLGVTATWGHDDTTESVTVILDREETTEDLDGTAVAVREHSVLCASAIQAGHTLTIDGTVYYVESVAPQHFGIYKAVVAT